MIWRVTGSPGHRIAHTTNQLPELSCRIGCLVEGEPGLFYPITGVGTDGYGQAVYKTAFDPTHQLVNGVLNAL